MMGQAICMTCHKKNVASNEYQRVRRIQSEIQVYTRNATDSEKEQAEKVMIQNPYLRQMCDYRCHCDYGMSCSELSRNQMMVNNLDIAEDLVLLSVVNKEKMYEMLRFFSG